MDLKEKAKQLIENTHRWLRRINNPVKSKSIHSQCKSDARKQAVLKEISALKKHANDNTAKQLEDLEKVINGTPSKHLFINAKFDEVFNYWDKKSIRALGSGSYGHVFTVGESRLHVIKIALIDEPGALTVGLTKNEVLASIKLSNLRDGVFINGSEFYCENFVKINKIFYVDDIAPQQLIDAWKSEERNKKEPGQKKLPQIGNKPQKFFVLKMENAGEPVSLEIFEEPIKVLSFMSQLVSALSVGERSWCFEHRDLHLGNLLLKSTEEKFLKYSVQKLHFKVQLYGVKLCIIDYTFSRISENRDSFFFKISNTQPNPDHPIVWRSHFFLYDCMAKLVQCQWDMHVPFTTVCWLKHLFCICCDNIERSLAEKGLTKMHFDEINSKSFDVLKKWKNVILNYDSCADFLQDVLATEFIFVQ